MRASDDLLAMSMYVVYNTSHVISHVAGGVAEATPPAWLRFWTMSQTTRRV